MPRTSLPSLPARPAHGHFARLLPLLLLSPLLGGCRYNFVPLIPKQAAPFELPLRLTQVTLTRQGEQLRLHAAISGQFDPGYLQVRWYDNARALGEDSVYLDTNLREVTFSLEAPAPGAYRAVLSFGGNVLRQAELYEVSP